MTAKEATYAGAAIIAESEIDGCGVVVDSAITATEVVEVPVKLSDMRRRPTSTSRASSSATNATKSAAPAAPILTIVLL